MLDSHSCNTGRAVFPSSFCIDTAGSTATSGSSAAAGSRFIGPISQDQWENDMHLPLQKAIDYCLSRKIGTLMLRPNRYPIKKPLRIAGGNLTITSTGRGRAMSRDACIAPLIELTNTAPIKAAIAIQATNTGLGLLLEDGGDATLVDNTLIGNVALEGITILSKGRTTTEALVHGRNTFSTSIRDCFIGGLQTPGGIGTVNGVSTVHTDMHNAHQGVGVLFDRNETVGINWLQRIDTSHIHWCTKKAIVMAASDSWITQNYISHTAGIAENDFSGNIYNANHIDTGRGIGDATGISMVERDPAEVPRKGATVISNNYIDIMEVAIGLSDATEDLQIIGNQLRANTKAHIALAEARHISITGNTLRSVTVPGFSPIKVSGTPADLTITGNVLRQPLLLSLQPFAYGNT